jgi:hypothetical protein
MKPIHLLLLAATLPAAAQDIWRCGPDGRSFQATPCAEGRTVALRAAPDAAAVAEAQAVVAREQLGLQTLAAQRRERERGALGAAGFSQPPQPPARIKPSRATPEACGISTTVARASRRGPAAPGCS